MANRGWDHAVSEVISGRGRRALSSVGSETDAAEESSLFSAFYPLQRDLRTISRRNTLRKFIRLQTRVEKLFCSSKHAARTFFGKSPMKLRGSSFVTVIMTAIVTTAASIVTPASEIVTPASAEILTVCANSTRSSATLEALPPTRFAGTLIPLSGQTRLKDDALIALWRDDEGFDILINWGGSDRKSLRAEGAQVIGASPSSSLVHLMVAYEGGTLEHFLFDLDDDGAGELLRSVASDVPDESSFDTNAVCFKPR
jgi:hypothetical protein